MFTKAKKWILAKDFVNEAALDNFKMVEETLCTELDEGDVQVEALFWSVDPYMRKPMSTCGDTMPGAQVGVEMGLLKHYANRVYSDQTAYVRAVWVTVSNSEKFPKGSHVIGSLGWRTHTNVSEDKLEILPETGSYPKSIAFGILGLTGMSAFIGVYNILNLKPGEILVVSTAAGAVGNVVGQLGKMMGCKVIGFCGSDTKCAWLKDELNFDHVFNYKTTTLEDALKKAAPDGVDCYFDNVGGEFCNKMVSHMKIRGRIAICGCISTYQIEDAPKGSYPYFDIVIRRMRVEGFVAWDSMDRWPEWNKQMLEWMQHGKIKNKEWVTEGFENMPQAFLELFKGSNIGKAVVKA